MRPYILLLLFFLRELINFFAEDDSRYSEIVDTSSLVDRKSDKFGPRPEY